MPGLSCSTTLGILVSQPGIEPTSSALQGRLLTTGPPGKSWFHDTLSSEIFFEFSEVQIILIFSDFFFQQLEIYFPFTVDINLPFGFLWYFIWFLWLLVSFILEAIWILKLYTVNSPGLGWCLSRLKQELGMQAWKVL